MARFTLALFVALLGAGVLIPSVDVAEDTHKMAECILPNIEEISSIAADMYHHPYAPLGFPDVVNFQIPTEKFAEVLQYFRPSEPDPEFRHPDPNEIGTIRINLKKGGCVRICWFEHGQNRLRFSYAGRRYVRTGDWIGRFGCDEALNVDGRIRVLQPGSNSTEDMSDE